jgi:hypothetical protein
MINHLDCLDEDESSFPSAYLIKLDVCWLPFYIRLVLNSSHIPLRADYVGFIKKVMKQMQQPQYTPMKKMEVDLRPLDEVEEKKANEGNYFHYEGYILGKELPIL